MYRNNQEPTKIILTESIERCLIITGGGVFRLKDGRMKELKPDPQLGYRNRAFWLHHALDKDFDPGEYEPSFIAEIN